MVILTLQREKCIGCNYCVEMAPDLFQMSKRDGKTVLLKSENNKGFHTLKSSQMEISERSFAAEKACPVKIIKVKIV